MQFSRIATLAALAALTSANTVEFLNQDSTERTIVFTAQVSLPSIPSLTVAPLGNATATFPTGWIGNFYSVSKGAEDKPGMLGEVSFDGWNGITFFDVSAIVNPDDTVGVKEMYPQGDSVVSSGCATFPCDHAYYLPDDVQTKSTLSHDLVCTLGTQTVNLARSHPRHFLIHKQ